MYIIDLQNTKLKIYGRNTPFIIFTNGWLKRENKYELYASYDLENNMDVRELLEIIKLTNLTGPIDLEIIHLFSYNRYMLKFFELDNCTFGGPGSGKIILNGIYKPENKIIQIVDNIKEYDFSNLDLS